MKKRNFLKAIGALFIVPFLPKKKEVPILNKLNQSPINPYCIAEKHVVYFYSEDATFRCGDYVAPRTARNKQVRVISMVPRETWITNDNRIVAKYMGEYYGERIFEDRFVIQETDWIKMFSATGDASSKRGTFIAVNHINHDNI